MAKTIAVAGKGGTGKTTVAALIISVLLEEGQTPILAVDADPDSNLGFLLGVDVEKTLGDLREDLLDEMKKLPAGMTKADYINAGLHQIIEERNGFDLITMGRGEGLGCYCYLNSLIRKFSEDLMHSYRWLVMDNEAGLEHISRRTTNNVDYLIVVVNDNPISIITAKNIEKITEELKPSIKKKYVLTNMLDGARKGKIIERLSELNMEYLGNIPRDRVLENAIFEGKPLIGIKDSVAKNVVKSIIERIGGGNGDS